MSYFTKCRQLQFPWFSRQVKCVTPPFYLHKLLYRRTIKPHLFMDDTIFLVCTRLVSPAKMKLRNIKNAQPKLRPSYPSCFEQMPNSMSHGASTCLSKAREIQKPLSVYTTKQTWVGDLLKRYLCPVKPPHRKPIESQPF